MPESSALQGRCVLVTRPAHQAQTLVQGLRAAGAEALLLPLLEIRPLADTQPLAALGARLADYSLVFFVSSNAVQHALQVLPRALWPAQLRIATVGPGSAQALREAGFDQVLLPERDFDSEGVLAMPAFQAAALAGRRVLILRGNGGRELLASTLRARGVEVDVVSCYQRLPAVLDVQPVLQRFAAGQLDAISLTSSEGAAHFVAQLGEAAPQLLASLPCFVPHPRIAAKMTELGARTVRLCEAGDAALISALHDYFG
ncbi:uroporphyrinogen-III synthase [Uliginosibacterium sediminicola]|uniref:Uroporphyrinogen-III synthase n=1 Tax=Uliginosibacterium sediminicola TaxID=2024550 RepID=A0ABU9YXQ3_9RHOO